MWLQAEAIEGEIWSRVSHRQAERDATFRAGEDAFRAKMKYAILVERHLHEYLRVPWDPSKFQNGGDGGIDYTDGWGITYDIKARDCRLWPMARTEFMYDHELYLRHGLRADVYILGGFTANETFLAGWINWTDLIQYGSTINLKPKGSNTAYKRIIIHPSLLSPIDTLYWRIRLANEHAPIRDWVRHEDVEHCGSTVKRQHEMDEAY